MWIGLAIQRQEIKSISHGTALVVPEGEGCSRSLRRKWGDNEIAGVSLGRIIEEGL